MVIKNIDFEKYNKLADKTFYRKLGKVVNVVGLTIESAGPDSSWGICAGSCRKRKGQNPLWLRLWDFVIRRLFLCPTIR